MARRRTCAHCSQRIPQPSMGRPRNYCSASCRQMAHRKRRRRAPVKNSYWTPEPLRSEVLQRWAFTLDAAAEAANHLADKWLGPDHPDPHRRDALAFDHWAHLAEGGTVWLNPPYVPMHTLAAFTTVAAATARNGTTVVGLLPSFTDAKWWWANIVDADATVEFLPRRLRFTGPHAKGYNAPWPCALIIWPATQ